MDRKDELRERPDYADADPREVIDRPHDDDTLGEGEEERREAAPPAGGILGLGDANPPREPVPSDGRGIQGVELDTERPGSRELKRSKGATGIDMGAGGEGTGIKRER